MTEEINFQTWICPTCFDDHPWLGHCTMRDDKGLFIPHPDDRSKIADEYRDRVAEIELLKSKIEEILCFCKGKTQFMWAASIVGTVLDCDFRDAEEELYKHRLRGEL